MGSVCGVQLDRNQCLNIVALYSSVDVLVPFYLPWQGNQASPGVDNWASNWLAVPNSPPSASNDPVGFAKNQDLRLEAFVRSSNNGAVWHIWQQADGTLSGWNDLGGPIDGGPIAAVNLDGRIELFARQGNTLVHNWQLEPNGGTGWSGWKSLGGSIDGQVAVGVNPGGNLEVFARGGGKLQHIWQKDANGVNGWSTWNSLGGALDGDPAVALNPGNAQRPGWLEVFVRSGGKLLHIWQQAGGVDGWSGWNPLGGSLSGDPVVGVNRDGRLEVFARWNNGALWHIWQQAPGANWSVWNSLGGNLDGNYTPAVGSNYDGRLEVFAMLVGGVGETINCNAQTAGGWSGWVNLTLSAPPQARGVHGHHATHEKRLPERT